MPDPQRVLSVGILHTQVALQCESVELRSGYKHDSLGKGPNDAENSRPKEENSNATSATLKHEAQFDDSYTREKSENAKW